MQRADGETIGPTDPHTDAWRVTGIGPGNDGVQKPGGSETSEQVAKMRQFATGVGVVSSVEDGQ